MEKVGKFYTSTCSSYNGNFLEELGFVHTKNIEEADVIIFGGGADIEPETYGEKAGSDTGTSPAREKIEREEFKIGLKMGKKFVGICRGHQLICAMAGGKLIQDVTGHSGTHAMTTFDGITVKTNSIHHQMVNPYFIKDSKDYQILAWSSRRISTHYLGAKDRSVLLPWNFKEIESIYFPKIRALGFQYHPEMMNSRGEYEPVMDWTKKIFTRFFDNKL